MTKGSLFPRLEHLSLHIISARSFVDVSHLSVSKHASVSPHEEVQRDNLWSTTVIFFS